MILYDRIETNIHQPVRDTLIFLLVLITYIQLMGWMT